MAFGPHDETPAGCRLFALTQHPDYDSRALLREQRLWEEHFAWKFRSTIQPHANVRISDRPLKIGYISGDFWNHVLGRNVLPIFREHDRSQFEIFCYSNVQDPDVMTERFRSLADGWRDIKKMSDQAAADLVRADRIDILVDLSLHTAGNRLMVLARKPAPVQVTFGGHPGGTGLSTIDWRLTDPYLDPLGESDSDYVEQSYRLPDSFWCYDPASMEWQPEAEAAPMPDVGPLPALTNGYITFGCLNTFSKVNDGVLELWSRVLQEIPPSKMLIMAPPGDCRERVMDAFAKFEVRPDRIQFTVFQPRRSYMAEFNRIDLGLDTLPYNGHTASLDSAWMGVPVISRIGRTVVGRAGLSQLSNLGLSELVARDDQEFIAIAKRCADDIPRLAELRRTMRRRMLESPLTDARRFTRSIETAYREMWKIWYKSGQNSSSAARA
jgi:protein O-GlcNAc transferase